MRVMVRLFLIFSIYIPRRKSQRGIQPVLYPVCWFTVSALISKVSAMRNCVSNGVRTSRCRADFFRLSKSRCDLPSRRAPDRLAALLTAFRLSIAFCLRRAFTGGSDPAFATVGFEPTPSTNGARPRCYVAYKGAAVARVSLSVGQK